MKINELIRQAREKQNISQRELGRRISKTGQYISYIENKAEANPGYDLLQDIATALNIPLSELMGITPIGDTYITKDGDIIHVVAQNDGEITESIALQAIASYINYIANEERYTMGSCDEDYKEIIEIIEEITRNKIIAYKQTFVTKINKANMKRRSRTQDSFVEMLVEMMLEVADGKEPDETTEQILKEHTDHLSVEDKNKIDQMIEHYISTKKSR